MNSIKQTISYKERLVQLNQVAIEQLQLLLKYSVKQIKKGKQINV